MQRPLWTGQIQISLVTFGVKLFPATDAKSEVHFHQLSRKTGARIKHQNVSKEEEAVGSENIVKGYEYKKDKYVAIEPGGIKKLRIPSRHNVEVVQFVDADDIDREYFDKPYFVIPESDAQTRAFAVVRKALLSSKKTALGKIAFGGREHLLAVMATNERQAGMMAFTMRYAEELRDPAKYFDHIKKAPVDHDQVSLAMEIIKKKTAKFEADKFTDEYEKALRELVSAKIKHRPLPQEEPIRKSAKVINLMDALRQSVHPSKSPRAARGAAAHSGLSLVKPAKSAKRKAG